LFSLAIVTPSRASELVHFHRGDIVVFLGGADVVESQFTGHLESRLTFESQGVRFRNLGWEGDTVYSQPRDVGFPALDQVVRRAGATVIVLQFGRIEALEGTNKLPQFAAGYMKLLDLCSVVTSRLVLVTPAPFESGPEGLPNHSQRNPDLAAFCDSIRTLATERKLPLIDLFRELRNSSPLTKNGLQLTPIGHARLANAFLRQLGSASNADVNADASWTDPTLEKLRQLIIAKNKLYFDYWRPQNWAFLGGDRVTQPSSHDHRNPKDRWFPSEMEKYIPLIEAKETEIERLARKGAAL
jgi:hypothetical protein